jgi:hypothetical protein
MNSMRRFNEMMDGIVRAIDADNALTSELKEQVYKLVSDCKTIAEYDPRLAMEVYYDAVWLGYKMGSSIIRDVFKTKS